MQDNVVYALDFDGVICDSAVETGITGWKAAAQIWSEMSGPLPPQEFLDQFRQVRPILETGYEAILIMRMVFQGVSVETILAGFAEQKQIVIKQSGKDISFLKQLFGETRDHWIQNSLDEWVRMNPLFPGVADKLKLLDRQSIWYIVTTKQERFVKQILGASQIQISEDRIFGLDRNMSKEDTLIGLGNNHSGQKLYFVEDRLPTLNNVLSNPKLQQVKLFLADWGYNTAQDRIDAEEKPIQILGIGDFLV